MNNRHTYLEISSLAFTHNITYFKNKIGNNALAVVLKGNGYGHGILEIATLCEQHTAVDLLCVATLSEALTIRKVGIQKPILVLGYSNYHEYYALNQNIAFVIDNLPYAQKLDDIGKKHGCHFKVHIKIDTGLSRLGISPQQTSLFIKQIQQLPYLCIEGILSHFIASDSNKELTREQYDLFTTSISSIDYGLIRYRHMSNTAAIIQYEYSSLYNMFRVGLGVYGFGNSALQPVLTWKTYIHSIKIVPAHSYVSYACTYKTTRATKIAILPIGYSDGYQLRFSNKTSVIINGYHAPVMGRVGMNMTMVDITDYDIRLNDEVIILGNRPGVCLTDLAHVAEIYNVREILTGINPALSRIITKE
jgi:alanine racemase